MTGDSLKHLSDRVLWESTGETIMKLYCEGHSVNKGWAISRTWSEAECRSLPYPKEDELRPVRFIRSRERAMALVERWNRRFAAH